MKHASFFILLCFSLLAFKVYAQVNHICKIEERTYLWPQDGTTLYYIPDEFTTTKYLQVNFHFMMKSDSTLNFRPFDDGLGNCSFTAYDYSTVLINIVNARLAGNEQMHLPPGNITPVLDRRYRLVLKNIYFHYDDNAYTFDDTSPGNLSNLEITNYSMNPESEINVFFVYDDNPNGYTGGGKANYPGHRHVIIKAAWQ